MQNKSIFNPELTITDDKWAVSFVVNPYHNDPMLREHAFLVVQTPDVFYRKEILHDGDNKGYAMVEEDERSIPSAEKLQTQFNLTVWKSSRATGDISKLGHNTWLISKAQVMEMFTDIESDKTTAPKFSIHGVASILKDGEFKQRATDFGIMFCSGAAWHVTAVALTIATGSVATVIPPLVAYAPSIVMFACATALGETQPFVDTTYRAQFKAHNCATWCVEKLTNLNIPEINKSLGFHFTDKFAYVTGLHIPADETHKANARKILTDGARHKVESTLGC